MARFREEIRLQSDSETVWEDYYERIRDRRVREARMLWDTVVESGVGATTFLAFDFCHFSAEEDCVRNLETQLSENYSINTSRSTTQDKYWMLHGTTSPDGVEGMDEERLVEWVEFMCDVAQSHGCVFSTWKLTDKLRNKSWSSEAMNT